MGSQTVTKPPREWSAGTGPQELTLVPCAAGLDGVSENLASDFEGTLAEIREMISGR